GFFPEGLVAGLRAPAGDALLVRLLARRPASGLALVADLAGPWSAELTASVLACLPGAGRGHQAVVAARLVGVRGDPALAGEAERLAAEVPDLQDVADQLRRRAQMAAELTTS